MGVQRINRATIQTKRVKLAEAHSSISVQDSEPADRPEAPEQPAEAPVEIPEEEKKASSPPTPSGKGKRS